MNILLLGGDSDSNLGDTAILAALCQCLNAAACDMRLTITGEPRRKIHLPGVVSIVPAGPSGFGAQIRAVAQQHLVILGGGGLFQDDDSRIKMPYWGSKLALLRAFNANLVGHSIGAGPLKHRESRAFARLACWTMKSVSVRDEFAKAALAPCTRHPIDVVPDPAFMLAPAPPENAVRTLREAGLDPRRPVIGVALRRWFHRRGGFIPHRIRVRAGLDHDHGSSEMDGLLDSIARAVRALAVDLDASVLMLPTYCSSHEGDDVACERLVQRLTGLTTAVLRLDDPALYKAITGRLALLISARMHPLILAAGMGTPIVGLAYNSKFQGLFDQLEIPRRMLWLEDSLQGSLDAQLISLAHEAFSDRAALTRRAQVLAKTTAARTVALLDLATPMVNTRSL
jgi:polysaccharide pyruvyl transferase WcaK-like protein